jgi:hypothetical protein
MIMMMMMMMILVHILQCMFIQQVVRLSDDLKKKGVLKTQEDVDKFWRDFGHSGLDQDIFRKDKESTPGR